MSMKLNESAIERDPNRVFSTAQVTELLNVHPVTVWRWVRAGHFPAPIKLGVRRIGWPATLIEQWIANQPKVSYGRDHTAA
jgi:predicted DNA-binding transcriptional regulator AlpA